MPRYTKIDIDKLYELFEEYADNEQLTIAQIAVREKIDVTTLKRLFNRIANYGNLDTRKAENVLPRSRFTSEIINQIVHLRTCGYSFNDIGKKVGGSNSYVRRLYTRRLYLLEKYQIKHKDGLPTGKVGQKFKDLLGEEKRCPTKAKW